MMTNEEHILAIKLGVMDRGYWTKEEMEEVYPVGSFWFSLTDGTELPKEFNDYAMWKHIAPGTWWREG